MYLEPTDLTVGQTYYECASGINLEAEVISPVEVSSFVDGDRERKQYRWKAKRRDGTEFDCLITEGFEHYGPRIYLEPQYVSINRETKEIIYKVI